MKLNFIYPGKTKESYFAVGLAAYFKRLAPMVEVQECILKSSSVPAGAGVAAEAQARAKETALIGERCGGGHLVVLDIKGEMVSSVELAARFDKYRHSGRKIINLVVGGAWGIDQSLLDRADFRLSLGPMTYPHELARLILLEQVYRAFTILNNLPYHK